MKKKKLLFHFGFSKAAMEKLGFTRDNPELAKLNGKPSYFTTVSA